MSMSYLSLNDLFLVGLALDISGAVLLAKGLLLSPRMLARLRTYWGLDAGNHEDRLQNRVAGEFGVSYLVAGFVLQFVGYSLEIAGVNSDTGARRLLAAVAMSAVVAGLAWAAWGLLHDRRLQTLEVAIAAEREAAGQEIDAEEKLPSS
jgi:hypothetical protein